MVLKKMLNKFRSKNEPKKASEEPNKSNSSKEQKKLKKIRSIKVSDKGPKKTTHLQQVTAEMPNYMKSTTSNEARKEKNKVTTVRALVKNSSLKLLRSSMKKNKRNTLQSSVYTNRAICSSNIKDSETPEPVNLNENHDVSALKTCNYSYCSLHGHKHGDLPSLKRFLSARRRQKSIKLRVCSSIKKKGDVEIELVEDVVNELFKEIHSNTVSRMNEVKLEDSNEESCSVTSIEDCGDKTSELSMEDINVINQFLELIKEGFQEETQFETAKIEQGDSEVKLSKHVNCNETSIHEVCSQTQIDDERPQNTIFVVEKVNSSEKEPVEEDWATLETGCGKREENISEANLNNFPVANNVKKCSSLVSRSKVKCSRLRRQTTKSKESVKVFNPWPPRLLALKAESEQEKVDLKHQNVDERKAAEEWMIDYALRKALRRLASKRKSKVPLLVAAFETVMP